MRATGAPVIAMLSIVGSQAISTLWQRDPPPRDRFDPAAFARGPARTRELETRFTWPSMRTFRTIHDRADGARPIRDSHTWGAAREAPTGKPEGPSTVDAGAWRDWTYATTLLSLERPLYEPVRRYRVDWVDQRRRSAARLHGVQRAMEQGVDAGLRAIQVAVSERIALDELGWDGAARFAARHGSVDLALSVRARHKPLGEGCVPYDAEPALRAYAALCYDAGRLACFLNLMYEPVALDTDVARVREVGLDAERFLRGLLYQFDVPAVRRRELSTWQLARVIHAAELAWSMGSLLRAEASRLDLDDHNRFRAAETLAYLRYQQDKPPRGWNAVQVYERYQLIRDIRAELETLSLPPEAEGWVSSLMLW